MSQSGTIAVEGVGDLLRAFDRVEKGLRRELRAELVGLAGTVAIKARELAEAQGLRESGQLIARIRPGLRSSYAYVTDTANRKSPKWPEGFNYPAVFEFGHGGARAFLVPAAKAEEGTVLLGLEGLLDRLTSEAGLQKGGLL